jgi:hypothetical protein
MSDQILNLNDVCEKENHRIDNEERSIKSIGNDYISDSLFVSFSVFFFLVFFLSPLSRSSRLAHSSSLFFSVSLFFFRNHFPIRVNDELFEQRLSLLIRSTSNWSIDSIVFITWRIDLSVRTHNVINRKQSISLICSISCSNSIVNYRDLLLFQDATNYVHIHDSVNDAVDDPMNASLKKKVWLHSTTMKNSLGFFR